jgi:alkylhydroperoxidase family enzyme
MSHIRTIPPEQAEPELAEAYRAIQLERGGEAHILEVQSLHPRALVDHHRLYRTLMFGPSPLTRAEREMIAVVVSAANGCYY